MEVESGTQIKDVAELDFENSLIVVNGYQKNRYYVLKDNDICSIRQFPTGVTVGGGIIIGIASAVIIAGISDKITESICGKGWYDMLRDKIRANNTNASNEEKTESYPSIAGCKNQSALGKAVPYILGKTLFSPYYICKNGGYTTISTNEVDGDTETFHNIYLLGQKDVQVEDVKFGLYDLASNRKSDNTEDVSNGMLDCTNASPFFNNSNLQVELQKGQNPNITSGEMELFPQKVIEESRNIEIPRPNGSTVITTAINAISQKYPQKVELQFLFNGLGVINDSGSVGVKDVALGLQYSVDGGNTWQFPSSMASAISFSTEPKSKSRKKDSNLNQYYYEFTYSKATKKQLRYVVTFDLTKMSVSTVKAIRNNRIEFRIWKVTQESTGSNTIEQVYLQKIRTWCYDKSKSTSSLVAQVPLIEKYRNKTTRIAVSVNVTENNASIIDELNCIVTGKCRTWNSTTREWSTSLSATNNVSAVALQLLSGDYRGDDYKYSDEDIDLQSFGRFYEWCNTQINLGEAGTGIRFTCDGALTSQIKTSDVLNNILSCGRGFLVLNGTQYGVFFDSQQEIPVTILNNQNVLEATNVKNFEENIDGYNVKFVNAVSGYQEDTFVAVPSSKDKDDPELKLQTVEYPYITNPFRAKAMALYQLACRKLRPETWSRKVSTDGNLIEIGNLIEVQDDTISVGIGEGAEITGFEYDNENAPTTITKIITDGLFTVADSSKDYGLKIITANGIDAPAVRYVKVNFTKTGDYSSFFVDISLDESNLPNVGDILSFGLYEKVTTPALCIGKKENGDGTFDLTLVPYQSGIYTADSGIINDFDSKITNVTESGGSIAESQVLKDFIAPVYNAVLTMDSAYSSDKTAKATLNVYKNGVLCEDTVYAEVTYFDLDTATWKSSADGTGSVTGYKQWVYNGNENGFTYNVKIFTEINGELLTSVNCSFGGTGAKGEKGDKGDKGEQGESGTNFMLDLFPEQIQTFANSDGTCTEDNIVTQCYLSFNTEYVTSWSLSVKHKGVNLVNGTDATWTWNVDHFELSIPTQLLENDSESFEVYATFTNSDENYTRIAVLQVSKYKGVEYLDFDLDYSSIKVSYDGVTPVISPDVITPKKYKKTSSGQFQTQEGYLTVQQFDGDGRQIGELKEVGYKKMSSEKYDSTAEYKAKMSPFMMYGYNNNGTVNNGLALGEKINGQFVAWVFYDRTE